MGRKPDATRPAGRAVDLATMPDAMRVADPTKSFGMDDEQSAREQERRDLEQVAMSRRSFVVAKQGPNEMEFSGERSESAATTG